MVKRVIEENYRVTSLWPVKKLGIVATLQRGFDLPSSKRMDGDYPVISSGGISGFHKEYKVKGPGVITGRYGSVGEVFYQEGDYWPLNTTLWVKDFHGNDEKFIYYLLSSLDFRKFSDKTGVPGVNRNDLHKIMVCLPPVEYQRGIVAYLEIWEQAIEKTKQLIAAKEKQKHAYMLLLLTGRKRLRGFTDKWRTFQLGDLFVERREPANDHLPLLSITREQGVISRTDVDRKDTSSEDKSKYLRICPGDIGYNTMRMWQGVSALSSMEGIVSPAYTICIPTRDINGLFMSYLFKLPAVIHLFYRYSQGLTSDTWNLKFHHFREIKVAIPELEEQKAIAEVFSTFDSEISLRRKQYDLLKKQKRGLMQKLLTGQWRVRINDGED